MTSKRAMGIVLTTAVVAGYAGAAVWSAWAEPGIELAGGYGEGDGLTRYALTTEAGTADPALLAALEAVPGVASAQWLDGDRALVAASGVTAERLRDVPGVREVELSPSVPVMSTVTDPYAVAYGWNLENTGSNAYQTAAVADADVDATTGWDTTTGAGRVVAVVDSGFDSDHPDLVGSLWSNPDERCGSVDTDGNGLRGDCNGWNFYTNSSDIDNGAMGTHGTSVSSVVGGRANNGVGSAGLAPNVSIMPLVIGGGSTVDVNLGARAIRYAVDHGADVINASWGGAVTGSTLQALREAVAYAAAHDVLVIAAAGNDSLNRDSSILYPASLTEPNVITVGSSTASDTVAAHSAYGASSVDLFAPGEKLPIAWNDGGMRVGNGTSFAAPHVAAAVAMYRAVMPEATALEIKDALLADVDPKAAFVGRSVTGGRLTMDGLAARTGEQVRYAFTSMTARPGTVTPTIGVSAPAASGRYSVDVGLGMEHAGEIWALADKDVTLDGTSVPTDDAGDARFDLGVHQALDGFALAPSMDLAAGRYVLTVQLYRDGEPVGRMTAAPLLVSVPGTAPGTSPGGSTPGGTTPGTTRPGTSPGGTTPAPGGSTPTTPGTPAPGTPAPTAPRTPTPGTPAPGTPAPGTPAPGTTTPGTPAPGTQPGTSPGGTQPGTTPGTQPGTSPGGTSPGGTSPGGSTPSTPAPGGTTPGTSPGTSPGGTAPTAPGTKTYPEVSDFRITSLSPDVVATSGGSLVTVTGLALPSMPTVRIGATATATVVQSSATRLVFRVPARVAGTYDVSVHARDGRSAVLDDALTYTETVGTAPGGTTPTSPAAGGTSPGTGTTPGTSPGTSPGGSTPGGSTPGGTSPGTGTPPAAGAEGPSGERLVRSDRFRALGHVWSQNCSVSCTGVAI
ncbi:S8 family serine peptidase [Blastococcus sp. TF02A_35]|uniref:S8 family serine peptidase n=1 Tax=Blastococcus sp. TF02A-35 TaxID=2559612 RepID=UPI00107466E6|nr:S8 family serine peptidase [Blastococcus sp. TF02A_35]TFV51994.1 hypothetical protein E4P43_08070 [Blastococcus sp. TF02A_35]